MTSTRSKITWVVLTSLSLTVPFMVLRGYVIATLWRWFVIDAFPTAPKLGIIDAIGFSLLITFITMQYKRDAKRTPDKSLGLLLAESSAFSIVSCLSTLGIGWLLVQFQ